MRPAGEDDEGFLTPESHGYLGMYLLRSSGMIEREEKIKIICSPQWQLPRFSPTEQDERADEQTLNELLQKE
jgi:hypothetical protein